MKHNHVKIVYAGASGSSFVDDPMDSDITFVRAYIVNGVFVDCDWADLYFVPFGQLHLRRLSDEERDKRHPAFVRPYEKLLDSYTADDWLEETTEDVIVIPVSSMEIVDSPRGTYADLVA